MHSFETTITGVAPLREQIEATEQDALFTALVHRQSRFIYRVAYALLRNAHDSEDVVQETFLKLFRSRAWEAMTDERAFLARTTYRLVLAFPKCRQSRRAPLQSCAAPAGAQWP